MTSRLVEELTSHGATVERLTRNEASTYFRAWCEAFCCSVKRRTGQYRYRGFHWHAFSYDFAPSVDGRRALELYRAEPTDALVVIPEFWRDAPCVRCTDLASPDLSDARLDVYVFPESLDWTIAFTHEQPNLGPFFTRREWCADGRVSDSAPGR